MTLDPHEKRLAAWFALVIIVAIAVYFWTKSTTQAAAASNTQPTQASEPYLYSTTPGIPDTPSVIWGGSSPIGGNINVTTTVNEPGYLSNGYIPLFGLVGFSGAPGSM
jgi:hypothetical protein